MKTYFLLVALQAAFLSLVGQSKFPYAATLEVREQGVRLQYEDSYVAHPLTGRKFADYNRVFKQFFLGKYTTEGWLVYDGILFEDIELQYNLFTQDLVVLMETEKIERYVTVTLDKVSRFSVYDHEFVHFPGDSVMEKGIYELAYAGVNSNVYIRRTSIERKNIEAGGIEYEYDPINRYYVKNEFGTFQISGKRKLIQAYQNSPLLISIIKKNKIKFSKKRIESGLVDAVLQLESARSSASL